MTRFMTRLILGGLAIGFVATVATGPAAAQGYSYTEVRRLGDPACGGFHTADFEVGSLSNSGAVLFASDLTTGNEGLFVSEDGGITEIMCAGDPAPEGGTFGGFGIYSQGSMSDGGDAAFSFGLEPFTPPNGKNAGVYRFNKADGSLSAALVPDVTPAPAGLGVFRGTFFRTWTNNRGQLAFIGVVDDTGDLIPNGRCCGLMLGLFTQSPAGVISKVVAAGDPAPGGSTFDSMQNPSINERGDIAFGAHVAGEECIGGSATRLNCLESVYLKRKNAGILSIAHQGAPAPGGGTFRLAFGPVINNGGQIAYIGDLTAPPARLQKTAVYLYDGALSAPVALEGDPMPGGGNFKSASDQTSNVTLNNDGDVAFTARLDTSSFGGCLSGPNVGRPDTGVYVRKADGTLQLVARTGDAIPGVGTINHAIQFFGGGAANVPRGSATINDRGQVAFIATLQDSSASDPLCANDPDKVLILATPVE